MSVDDSARNAPASRDRASHTSARTGASCVSSRCGPVIAVAGEMDLPDAIRRHAGDVGRGIEAVVDRAHVDVVDVEEDAAVGAHD